jgi:hypothetical protein
MSQFGRFDQQKNFLPFLGIELHFPECPACNLVTIMSIVSRLVISQEKELKNQEDSSSRIIQPNLQQSLNSYMFWHQGAILREF